MTMADVSTISPIGLQTYDALLLMCGNGRIAENARKKLKLKIGKKKNGRIGRN